MRYSTTSLSTPSLVAAIAFAAALTGAAEAQETEAAPAAAPAPGGAAATVDTLLVTAAPYERASFDVIVGTGVLDGLELDRELDASLGETLTSIPGVTATYFGPAASRPIVRGLGGERTLVLNEGIGTFDASTTSPDHAVAVDPLMAERIEVLRGAGALLYGTAAIGGVVNVIDGRIPSAVPEDGIDAAARFTYGTNADSQSAAAAMTAGHGNWAVHLEGFLRNQDDLDIPGFAESARLRALEEEEEHHEDEHGHDEHGHEEDHHEEDHHDDEHDHEHEHEEEAFGFAPNTALRSSGASAGLSYLWGGGRVGFAVSHLESDYGVPFHAHGEGHDHGHDEEHDEHDEAHGHDEHGEEDHHEDDHHDDHDHDHDHDHGDVSIELEQTRFDFVAESDLDMPVVERAKLRFGYADYEHVEIEGDMPGTVFSNESWEGRLEFVQRRAGGLTGAFGVQLFHRDFSAIGEEAFVPPNETFRWGLFAVEEYETGPFVFDLGGRFEMQDVEAPALGIERSFETFSAAGGASFRPAENWLVGVNLSRTERAPNAEELFSDGPHLATESFEIGDPTLDSESAVGVEGTIRKRGGRVQGGVNVFYTTYDGFIYQRETGEEEDGLPVFRFTQTDADFFGAEFQARALVYEAERYDLFLDTDAEWVHARDEVTETPLPRIPPFSLGGGLEMESRRIDARAEVKWFSEVDDTAAFELPTDAYTLVNASVTYRPWPESGNVAFTVQGRNLLDSEARRHASFLKDVLPLPGRDVRFSVDLSL